MEWKFVINDENKYLEVITSGVADVDSSLNMATSIASEMKSHQFKKVLIDHRNLSGVIGSTMDIYNRPKALKDSGAEFGSKIAEIIKPEHVKLFRFFETVCVNRGFQVSIFQDKEKALSWLL